MCSGHIGIFVRFFFHDNFQSNDVCTSFYTVRHARVHAYIQVGVYCIQNAIINKFYYLLYYYVNIILCVQCTKWSERQYRNDIPLSTNKTRKYDDGECGVKTWGISRSVSRCRRRRTAL